MNGPSHLRMKKRHPLKLPFPLRRKVWIESANRSGSVEHYYHFVLGYLLPLCGIVRECDRDFSVSRLQLRECGPMNRIISEFGFRKVVTMDKIIHARKKPRFLIRKRSFRLNGFDNGKLFVKPKSLARIRKCAAAALELIRGTAHHARDSEAAAADLMGRRTVVIGRAKPADFYLSESESIGSGSSRRSIGNFDALVENLEQAGWQPVVIYLEDKSLAYQMALFQQAEIIVAQHGAALVNLLWCKPGTKVVEIVPDIIRKRRMFEKISAGFQLSHKRIIQQGLHSPVTSSELLACFEQFRSEPSPPPGRNGTFEHPPRQAK